MSPVRGSAGFRYTPVGGGGEVTVALNAPLQDVSAAHRGRSYSWDAASLNPADRETVTTSTGHREITATVFIHPDSDELLVMLSEMVQGAVASYFPDLSGAESYPSVLTSPDDVQEILRESRRPYGEWNYRIGLRHAEGGTYTDILLRRSLL